MPQRYAHAHTRSSTGQLRLHARVSRVRRNKVSLIVRYHLRVHAAHEVRASVYQLGG